MTNNKDVIETHIVDRIEPLMGGSTSDTEETSSRLLLDFLLNMMQLIENQPTILTSVDRNQIGSLGEKLDFLLENRDSRVSSNEARAVKDANLSQIMVRYVEEMNSSLFIDILVFILEQMLDHPRCWGSLESEDDELFRKLFDVLQCLAETSYDSDGVPAS